MIEELWSGRPPATARRTLTIYISRLRTLLGDNDRVRASSGSYTLVVHDHEVDASTYRRLRSSAARAQEHGDLAGAERLSREALDLWRGEAYSGFHDMPSVATEAATLDQDRLACFEDWADAALATGQHRTALGPLEEMVADHPYRERLRWQWMLALYRDGRQADALAAYRDAYELLTAELGVEPSADLQELHQAILTGDLAGIAADSPRADVGRVEISRSVPNMLPRAAADFTGRAAQLAALDTAAVGDGVASPLALISAVTGAAGVGKTALAVYWARGALRRFPDAQLYVDLQGFGPRPPLDTFAAVSRLLRQLGMAADQIPQDEQSALDVYRATIAPLSALVILDNAYSDVHVRPLLTSGARCMTVVTSRNRLSGLVAINGARRVALDILTVDEGLNLARTILGSERVDAEPDAAATLVELCGRLPLAMRIALVALTEEPKLSIGDHVTALSASERLSALEVAGDVDSSVRIALHHTYRRLDAAAQRLLRLLGTLPSADFGRPAAAALAGVDADTVVDLLDKLCASHLVTEYVDGRYRLHDLVNDFAAELAEREEAEADRDAARERLLTWYVAQAHRADSRFRREEPVRAWVDAAIVVAEIPDVAAAIAWFDLESANLMALVHATETTVPARCWQLAALMYQWQQRQRGTHDWLETSTVGLRAAAAAGDLEGDAAVRNSLAIALFYAGRPEESIPHLEQILENARRDASDPRAELIALRNLGGMLGVLRRTDDSVAYLQEALAIAERFPELEGERSTILENIGFTYQNAKQPEKALPYQRQSVLLHEVVGSDHTKANATNNLAITLLDLREFDEAVELLHRAMKYAEAAGHLVLRRNAAINLGYAALWSGHADDAWQYVDLAESILDDQAPIDLLRNDIRAAAAVG
jgi:DNA-binding SARP family transcriptional activator